MKILYLQNQQSHTNIQKSLNTIIAEYIIFLS